MSVKRQPGVKEFCAQCSAYLHCCLNCRFHDPSLHNECKIPNTEWVGDRKGANFCDEFEFADTIPGGNASETKKDQARQALDGLFGGSAPKPKTLDDLFKK
ncbi:MAG TPA: hypothetical protein PLI09_18580 [Candidatus Hydrogenedentes bacterium]|nr:hypothetical protein [Candidatus Hydrogenedentota bacterium]